LKTEYIKYFP